MTAYDDAVAQIDALHDEAEELVSLARMTADPVRAGRLRKQATAKVRAAARLRAQIGE